MFEPDRRSLLGLVGAALTAPSLAALPSTADVLPLWPGTPPGGPSAVALTEKFDDQSRDPSRPDRFVTEVSVPRLVVRRAARPNGSAVLLIPGGGYRFLSYDNEGESQARWLNARGITAFILLHRLPGEGWQRRADVPLQDAQRAIRLIRANAARFGVRPDRIAVIGFSAGGHLAGSLATRHAERVYAPGDAIDTLSARPDLVGLLYPVISMAAPFTHAGSRDALLGLAADNVQRHRYSVEEHGDAGTPPCFLAHAGDDGLVPPANSIAFYTALQARGRPAELHIFASGGHGFGVRPPESQPASAWPRLFCAFAAAQGVLPPA